MSDQIVSQGEQIKPELNLDDAVALSERLYGIKVECAKQLDGYDDKNYYLKVSEQHTNPFLKQIWPHGYVLKVMNSSDSRKLNFVEALCEIMCFLDENDIKTPQPQKNINGKLFSLETLQNIKSDSQENHPKRHVVRLLTYQEGTLMKDIPWSYSLHYKVGRYTAQLDLIMQNFSHPAYKEYSSLWMLKNVANILEYLHVVKNKHDYFLVEQVIQCFKEKVMANFDSLKLGIIHGDIHEQNLVCNMDEDGEWQLSAVLDFGDSHHSAYVIELAQAMTYMMLESESVESGHHVLAGYCSIHPLPTHELRLLKVCVCARLCQSLVLGLYTTTQDPGNEYVLSTQRSGWNLLRSLWPKTNLDDVWFSQLTEVGTTYV